MTLYSCTFNLVACRFEAREQSEMVNQLLFGEEVYLIERQKDWVKIKNHHDGYESFIDRKIFDKFSEVKETKKKTLVFQNVVKFVNEGISTYLLAGSLVDKGLIHDEKFEYSRDNIQELAKRWLGSPYLWGGRSIFGVDCSGFTQIVFRLIGINLKRDASEQVLQGDNIDFEDVETGDLAFFNNDKGKITHVGIILIKNEGIDIIHASGEVRIDQLDFNGILRIDTGEYSHKLHSIKRCL